jgi:MFS family permease
MAASIFISASTIGQLISPLVGGSLFDYYSSDFRDTTDFLAYFYAAVFILYIIFNLLIIICQAKK